jgi:hypothetical protein
MQISWDAFLHQQAAVQPVPADGKPCFRKSLSAAFQTMESAAAADRCADSAARDCFETLETINRDWWSRGKRTRNKSTQQTWFESNRWPRCRGVDVARTLR